MTLNSSEKLSIDQFVPEKNDVIDNIFNSLDTRSQGFIYKQDIINALQIRGILEGDSRIQQTISSLKKVEKTDEIDSKKFREIVASDITLIEKALTGLLIVPDFKNFCSFVTNLYNRIRLREEGKVSDIVSKLSTVKGDEFGISVCTVDGQRFNIGAHNKSFPVDSISTAINYCLAIEEHGASEVHKKIGKEPKEIKNNYLMLNSNGLPHNPFATLGEIMCTSMLKKDLDIEKRFLFILEQWEQLAGGIKPGFNNSALIFQKDAADPYYTGAYYMYQKNILSKDVPVSDHLEILFRSYSIESTTHSLALIASTLANSGICPSNGRMVFNPDTTKHCLSLMNSYGMSESSSEFAFSIGLPAKKANSGAIILVIPQVMGICIWSPKLNDSQDSVRGMDFCTKLIERFNFHIFEGYGKDKINPLLLKNERKIKECNGCLLAASQGDVNELERLYSSGANLNEADYDGRTGIHLAASEGHMNAVTFFIEKKVEISPRDRWGGTPLADASRHKHADVVQLLKKYGAQI